MEENTMMFADENPNFNFDGTRTKDALYSQSGSDAIQRWFDPSIAEKAQFERENYFVDKANAFNEYMYNKQNEYNTPTAQMERMKEAGINPLLAAGAIAGNGSTAAQPAAAAQGAAGMNTANINPIEQFMNIAKTLGTMGQSTNEWGKVFGFGKENRATIKQIEANATKAAEEADFTFWQKRQFKRTMRLMYDQAEKNLKQTEAAIKNLQAQYEKLQQEKYNIAADTNLKVAQTGETLETTKDLTYKNAEEEFKKTFREIYGIQLNESDMSMLVQAVLGGHGDKIIEAIANSFGEIAKSLGQTIKNNLPTIPRLFPKATPRQINGLNVKEIEVNDKKWNKDFVKEQKRYWDAHPKVRQYWENKGGFEEFIKVQKKIRLNQ